MSNFYTVIMRYEQFVRVKTKIKKVDGCVST